MARSRTTTLRSDGLSMDVRDFRRFATALRRAQPALASGLRVKLRAAAEVVAAEAKRNLEGVSKSVPPTIRVQVRGLDVAVLAGKTGVPMAGLLEDGNKGSTRKDSFRHPVFGNAKGGGADGPWVDQPMHPYLLRALETKASEAEALVVEALDDAIRQAVEL